MEDQNQQNSNPPQVQPLSDSSSSSYISSSQPKKVLQPSAAFVQEVRAEQAEQAAAEPQQPQASVQNPTQQSVQTPLAQPTPVPSLAAPDLTAAPPQPAMHAQSSIYPEATRGINSNGAGYPPPAPANDEAVTKGTYTFDDGYVIGKTIFIYQFIAGLVIGLLSSHLILTFFHDPILLAIVYVVEYLLVLLYLPYYVLRSESVSEPLWPSLIGTAVQTIIIAIGYALMAVILKAAGSSGIFLVVIISIGSLVASYFLTKLSWGVAFSLIGKIKNKVIVKAIGIGLIALFVGSIAYHFGLQSNHRVSNAAASVQHSTGLTRYLVTGNPAYSVDFYAGSKTSREASGGGMVTYSTGHGVQGVSFNVANAITQNATSSCSSTVNSSEFNFEVQGSTGIVCVSNTKNLTNYIGHIQVDGKSYVVNMFAFSYSQNLATIKTIFNSTSID